MRSNFRGLAAYLLFLVGVTAGGLAIVAFASSFYTYAAIGAVVGVGGIALGAGAWFLIARYEAHGDPLEPYMTRDGARRYERRYRMPMAA